MLAVESTGGYHAGPSALSSLAGQSELPRWRYRVPGLSRRSPVGPTAAVAILFHLGAGKAGTDNTKAPELSHCSPLAASILSSATRATVPPNADRIDDESRRVILRYDTGHEGSVFFRNWQRWWAVCAGVNRYSWLGSGKPFEKGACRVPPVPLSRIGLSHTVRFWWRDRVRKARRQALRNVLGKHRRRAFPPRRLGLMLLLD